MLHKDATISNPKLTVVSDTGYCKKVVIVFVLMMVYSGCQYINRGNHRPAASTLYMTNAIT